MSGSRHAWYPVSFASSADGTSFSSGAEEQQSYLPAVLRRLRQSVRGVSCWMSDAVARASGAMYHSRYDSAILSRASDGSIVIDKNVRQSTADQLGLLM